MSNTVITTKPSRHSLTKRIHTTTSKITGLFVLLHLLNHLFALAGAEKHIQIMNMLRLIYRHPLVETLLIAAVVCQIITGVILFVNGRKLRKGLMEHLQAWSGLYMSFFFVIHALAVFVLGRYLVGVDTNFYFAAAGLQQLPAVLFFAPYYSMSILSFGVHITCSLQGVAAKRYGRKTAQQLTVVLICLTVMATCLILLAFSGLLYPIS